MDINSALYMGLGAIWLLLLVCYRKAGALFKCTLFTAFTGAGALGVIWLLGRFITLPLAITPWTLGVAGVLGIPGVFCMLLIPLI